MALQWLNCAVVCTSFILSGLASSNASSDRYCPKYHVLNESWRSVQVEDLRPPRRCDDTDGFTTARWYRFMGEAGTAMPTEPPPSSHRCGSDAPVWMNGANPTYEDGVVARKACARFSWDICSWTWTIHVKRCPEGFLIYKLKPVEACRLTYCGLGVQNVTVDDVARPVSNENDDGSGALDEHKEVPVRKVHSACHDYRILNEPQRSIHNTDTSDLICDKRSEVENRQWYRFEGEGGGMIPTERPLTTNRCGTHAPVWMKGKHPTVNEGVVTRTVCAFWDSNECRWSWKIKVLSCPGGYFVYRLRKPSDCLLAYCTTDGAPQMATPPPTPVISEDFLSDDEDEVGSGEPHDKVLLARKNLALGKPTRQSSLWDAGYSGNAVDGDRSTNWYSGSCTHTKASLRDNVWKVGTTDPWWYVDLGSSYPIGKVVIVNRRAENPLVTARINPFKIHIGNSKRVAANPKCGLGEHVFPAGEDQMDVSCGGIQGRYVGIRLPGEDRILTLCEVEVYAEVNPQTTLSPVPTEPFSGDDEDDVGSGASYDSVHPHCVNHEEVDSRWRDLSNNESQHMCDKSSDIKDGRWHRFLDWDEKEANLMIPTERPLTTRRCGTHAPVWMKGRHPTVEEGVVTRTVCAFWDDDECNWSSEIDVMACPGGYFVYKLPIPPVCQLAYCTTDGNRKTTNDDSLSDDEEEVGSGEDVTPQTTMSSATTFPVPTEAPPSDDEDDAESGESRGSAYTEVTKLACTRHYVIDEPWRSVNAHSEGMCDQRSSLKHDHWYRFVGAGGTMMPTERPLETNRCGTHAPVWMKGQHPTSIQGAVRRTVCAFWEGEECHWSWTIHVMACPQGYYVYKLPKPTICDAAYCTTEPPTAWSASSEFDSRHSAYRADINIRETADAAGAWAAATNNQDQWLLRDLGDVSVITGIITKGRNYSPDWPYGRHDQYVTSYVISYGSENGDEKFYTNADGKVTVFSGNYNRDTEVKHDFSDPITARFIKIHPRSWHGHIAMRAKIVTGPLDEDAEGSGESEGSGDMAYIQRGDTQYKIFTEAKTYDAAKKTCAADGGHLAVIKTEAVYNYLLGMIGDVDVNKDYWIGLDDQAVENSWTWSDGEPLNDGGFTKWAPGEPNNAEGIQDCGQLWAAKDFQWDDDRCFNEKYFICQIGPGEAYDEEDIIFEGSEEEPLPTQENGNGCPENNIVILPGGKYYYAGDDAKTYEDAQTECRRRGGIVAIPRDEEEQRNLVILKNCVSRDNQFWLGVRWTSAGWVDGRGAALGSFTTWAPGEPNDRYNGYRCAHIVYGNKEGVRRNNWADAYCNSLYNYVCEIEQDNVPNVKAASCSEVKASNPASKDGEYTLHPFSTCEDVSIRVYCHNMASEQPEEFLTLPSGPDNNFANIFADRLRDNYGGRCSGPLQEPYAKRAGTTKFSKIRIKFENSRVKVIRDDYTFASTDGYNNVTYGEAGDCYSWKQGCAKGTFKLNLTGTDLSLASEVHWVMEERYPGYISINDMFISKDRTVASARCGGWCGHCWPVEKTLLLSHPQCDSNSQSSNAKAYTQRGDTQYKIYTEAKTYDDAKQTCAADGGHLVDIKTAALHNFLLGMINDVDAGRDYWIGLSDVKGGNDFKWSDGTPVDDCDYSHWAPREPANVPTTGCVQLWSRRDFKWDDDLCEKKDYFICQKGPGEQSACGKNTGCPISGYIPLRGACYKKFAELKTFAEARERCAADGGLIAMPRDRATNRFITNLHPGVSWLGLTDIKNEGQWVFEDGQTLKSSGYSNWARKEPNNADGNEDCAEFQKTRAFWNDVPCNTTRGFTCQIGQGKSTKEFYQGCYKDGERRRLPHALLIREDMTAEVCVQHCRQKGYTYAGTQYYKECWCGTELPTRGSREDSECATPCGGDQNEMCGGEWRLSVYKVMPVVDLAVHPEGHECQISNGASYRGKVAVTKSGRTCQRWDQQTPHKHTRTSANYPSSGLEMNFCRNPDATSGVWCYTTDPNKRWELCDVPVCGSLTGNPITQQPVSMGTKATTGATDVTTAIPQTPTPTPTPVPASRSKPKVTTEGKVTVLKSTNVTLKCTVRFRPRNIHHRINWYRVGENGTQGAPLITYINRHAFHNNRRTAELGLVGRLEAVDDHASLRILRVKGEDSGTYRCEVMLASQQPSYADANMTILECPTDAKKDQTIVNEAFAEEVGRSVDHHDHTAGQGQGIVIISDTGSVFTVALFTGGIFFVLFVITFAVILFAWRKRK